MVRKSNTEENSYKFPNSEILIKNNNESKMKIELEKKKIKNFFENYKIDIDCKDVYISTNSITYVIDLKCKTKVSKIKSYKTTGFLFEKTSLNIQENLE